MKNHSAMVRGLAIGIGMCLMLGVMSAAADQTENKIGYAIRPNLPDNQIDKDMGYFYLDVEPGTEQTISVTVYNRNDQDIQVWLEANAAISNQNGLIEYAGADTSGFQAPSNADNSPLFEDVVKVFNPLLTVPANGSEDAQFWISTPEAAFEGELLGGLVITKMTEQEGDLNGTETGMAIRNVYAYAIAVRLRESEATIKPELRLIGTRQGIIAGRQALYFDVENAEPLVMKDIALSLSCTDDQGNIALERDDVVHMAPNSVMPYCLLLDSEQNLVAGNYVVNIDLEYQDVRWNFVADLVVD